MASIFSEKDLVDIERFAIGLSKAEVLLIYYKEEDDLTNADLKIFNMRYNRGRVMGKERAINCLFQSMEGKEGGKSALSYLIRVAEEWRVESKSNAGLSALGSILEAIDQNAD